MLHHLVSRPPLKISRNSRLSASGKSKANLPYQLPWLELLNPTTLAPKLSSRAAERMKGVWLEPATNTSSRVTSPGDTARRTAIICQQLLTQHRSSCMTMVRASIAITPARSATLAAMLSHGFRFKAKGPKKGLCLSHCGMSANSNNNNNNSRSSRRTAKLPPYIASLSS